MITNVDIQIAAERFTRRTEIRLSPFAIDFLAILFNSAIYEAGRGNPLENHQRILNFLNSDFPGLLADVSGSLRIKGTFSAIDVIHWLIPKFPDQIASNPQLAFMFDKE